MKYIATFDVGTTAVKGVIVTTEGNAEYSSSREIKTHIVDDYKEQNPKDWYSAFLDISKDFFENGFNKDEIIGIIMSGQMQDLIVIDTDINPVQKAILYSDGRAFNEAEEVINKIGLDKIKKTTGNNLDGSMPFAKLIWLNKNYPEIYNKTHKILISSKDYCISKLTGNFVTDVTSASTAGVMDIKSKTWMKEWFELLELDIDKLPEIKYCDEVAGEITEAAALESGYLAGTSVYTGTGDAGATTLASGILKKKELNINIGTSGWVASISKNTLEREGVFNLSAIPRDLYINVVPFLNAGNVHNWISDTLNFSKNKDKYKNFSDLLKESKPGSNGLLFLPYLVGERFPIMDSEIKGCYYGLTPNIEIGDIARATLEGVAFSIRQGLEQIEHNPEKISLIGGGAKEECWCQIFSDVLGQEIYVNNNSEYLPAVAITSSVLLDMNIINGYDEFIGKISESKDMKIYKPNKNNKKKYDELFNSFKKLYPAVKELENK